MISPLSRLFLSLSGGLGSVVDAVPVAQTPAPIPTGLDIDLSDEPIDPIQTFVDTFRSLWEGFLAGLPRIAVALVVFAVFVVIGRVARRILEPRLTSMRTHGFGRVFSTLAYAGFVIVGLLVALPIAFVGLGPAGILGGLSVLALAAGFAFQDIAANLMAGVLLVFRQPFTKGDQIEVNEIRGTVEAITIRETQIKTFQGHLILVPNKDVYTNAIDVQTHFDRVRTDLAVGVGYDSDLSQARELALSATAEVDGVLDEPEPQAFFTEFGASAMTFDLRYWTSSRQVETRSVQDRVVEAVYDAYNAAGIDLPFTVVTLDTYETFDDALASALDSRDGSGEGPAGGDSAR